MKPRVNRLEVGQLAEVLSAVSEHAVTAQDIATCVDRGAPTNDDGTLSLLSYTAWLVIQFHERAA